MDGIFAGLENSKMDPRERLVGKRDRRLVDTQKRIQASREGPKMSPGQKPLRLDFFSP